MDIASPYEPGCLWPFHTPAPTSPPPCSPRPARPAAPEPAGERTAMMQGLSSVWSSQAGGGVGTCPGAARLAFPAVKRQAHGTVRGFIGVRPGSRGKRGGRGRGGLRRPCRRRHCTGSALKVADDGDSPLAAHVHGRIDQGVAAGGQAAQRPKLRQLLLGGRPLLARPDSRGILSSGGGPCWKQGRSPATCPGQVLEVVVVQLEVL